MSDFQTLSLLRRKGMSFDSLPEAQPGLPSSSEPPGRNPLESCRVSPCSWRAFAGTDPVFLLRWRQCSPYHLPSAGGDWLLWFAARHPSGWCRLNFFYFWNNLTFKFSLRGYSLVDVRWKWREGSCFRVWWSCPAGRPFRLDCLVSVFLRTTSSAHFFS